LWTIELKSADSDSTIPETCEPTWTVVTGCSVPVADTRLTMAPRETAAVVRAGGTSPRRE
jgi:hypothetical protein